jgi:hypothetical protein
MSATEGPDRAGDADRAGGADRPHPAAETDWERRRRLAAVFGAVRPETTRVVRARAERSTGAGDGRGDDWLRAQVPPHLG